MQSPCPCSSPLLTHTSAGDTQTQFWLSLCGVSGSWCTQGLFESSKSLWRVWGLIINAIFPLLPSCWGFSFALGHGVSFFDGIQHSPVDSCSAVSCNFGVLAGEDEHTSFYSAILRHILIPACNSSSPAFLMYSAYRLSKQGDSRQLCHIPFSILNQWVVPYRVLTLAKIKLITFFVAKDGEAIYGQQKQYLQLPVAQIISFS